MIFVLSASVTNYFPTTSREKDGRFKRCFIEFVFNIRDNQYNFISKFQFANNKNE